MRKSTHTTLTGAAAALLAALCLSAAPAAQPAKEPAQEFRPTPPQRAEAERLRRALEMTVGENFEVARARLTRRSVWHGGQLYWLAHLRARRAGEFQLRYKYRYKDHAKPQDPLYTFVEHDTAVRVGPRGCARRPRYNSVCVGDTVILPVVFNDYTEHTFSLAAEPFKPTDAPTEKAPRGMEEHGLRREDVPNPASEFLKYLGSRAHYMPHRAGGYTLEFYATFEAVRPGSFNLAVGAGGAVPPSAATAESVPVVVVGSATPVTVLSSRENVRGYTERFASTSGNNYLTTPVVLQTGELLTLKYGGYSVRGRSAGGESREALEASVKDRPPSITLLPFSVDPSRDFNEWVVEFLPPPRRR